jgi:hypothetical protein
VRERAQQQGSLCTCVTAAGRQSRGRQPGRRGLRSLELEAAGHARALFLQQVQPAAPGNYCSHAAHPAQLPSRSPPTRPAPPRPAPARPLPCSTHLGEGLVVEDVLGAGRERHVQREEVGGGQSLLKRHQLHANCGSGTRQGLLCTGHPRQAEEAWPLLPGKQKGQERAYAAACSRQYAAHGKTKRPGVQQRAHLRQRAPRTHRGRRQSRSCPGPWRGGQAQLQPAASAAHAGISGILPCVVAETFLGLRSTRLAPQTQILRARVCVPSQYISGAPEAASMDTARPRWPHLACLLTVTMSQLQPAPPLPTSP